jgi:hypothetical protein
VRVSYDFTRDTEIDCRRVDSVDRDIHDMLCDFRTDAGNPLRHGGSTFYLPEDLRRYLPVRYPVNLFFLPFDIPDHAFSRTSVKKEV